MENTRIKEDFHMAWSYDVNVVAPPIVMEINTRMQNKWKATSHLSNAKLILKFIAIK